MQCSDTRYNHLLHKVFNHEALGFTSCQVNSQYICLLTYNLQWNFKQNTHWKVTECETMRQKKWRNEEGNAPIMGILLINCRKYKRRAYEYLMTPRLWLNSQYHSGYAWPVSSPLHSPFLSSFSFFPLPPTFLLPLTTSVNWNNVLFLFGNLIVETQTSQEEMCLFVRDRDWESKQEGENERVVISSSSYIQAELSHTFPLNLQVKQVTSLSEYASSLLLHTFLLRHTQTTGKWCEIIIWQLINKVAE